MSKYKAHTLMLLASLMWGVTFPISKFILGYMEPEHYSFIRYASATLILFIYLLFFKKESLKVNFKQIIFLMYTGVLCFYGYAFFEIKSMAYISPSVASLFLGLGPIAAITIEVLLKRRKIDIRTILIIVLGLTGIYLIIGEELKFGGDLRGYIYMSLAMASLMLYLFKATGTTLNPLVTIAYQFLFATVFHTIGFLTVIDVPFTIDITVVYAFIYLIIFSTIICYTLYFISIRELGAGIVSVYDNLVFVIGFVSSALVFSSDMSMKIWISFAIILISVGISLTLETQK